MRLNAILESSGENETKPVRGTGSCWGSSASRPTVKSWPLKSLNDFILDRNAMSGRVFSQESTMLFGPIRSEISSRFRVAEVVSLFGAPPSAGITYTSVLPSYCDVKASWRPSAEKRGNDE